MNPTIETYLQTLADISTRETKAFYLVGGSVRDWAREEECSDWDFAVPDAPKTARLLADQTQRPLVPLDETPGHETYRVVLKRDLHFDFTTLQGQTIEEDLAQRDFTINAMAISLPDFIEGKTNLIDPFNGQNDLSNKIIRVVPGQAFEEDPLRLLRAFRFASTLGFDIEPQTLAQIKTHKTKLNEVAQERITYELLIFMGAPRSRLDLMEQTGLLEVVFRGISELKTKPGTRPGTTLWNDTRNTFTELESILLKPDHFLEQHVQQIEGYIAKNNHYAILKLSALVRSLATTATFDVTDFLGKFRLSNSDIQFVYRTLKFSRIALSEAHSSTGGFKKDSTIYQFIHRSGNELISSLLLSFAVRLGDQKDIKYFIPLINRILDFYTEKYLPARGRPTLFGGNVLKSKFQLTPSPQFSFILEKVEEARVLGIIQTSEEAEQLAKKLITSQVGLAE